MAIASGKETQMTTFDGLAKEDESDSDWENWWYYCELHEGDWFCTDDYGQSSDYANSADNDRYTNGYDGGDDGGSDDEWTMDDWVNDGRRL